VGCDAFEAGVEVGSGVAPDEGSSGEVVEVFERGEAFGDVVEVVEVVWCESSVGLAVNPLAAGRVEPLNPAEQGAVAAATVAPLLAAWKAGTPRPGPAWQLDLQLVARRPS
jgi:hypothetical protein